MRFICVDSNTTAGGHKGLYRQLMKNDGAGATHIFIVPDRYTLGVEKEICEECFENGTFHVDVCSFTRLAVKSLGTQIKKCLSKEGTVLLLSNVIADHNDKLIYYKDIKSVGFARELFAAMASLRSSGIAPELLSERAERMEGATADKLRDISLLYKEYEKALRERWTDTVTRVELLRDRWEELPVASSHVYILGFNIFSGLQLSLIKKMIAVCPSVSVSFCSEERGGKRNCFPTQQREELIAYCKEKSVPVMHLQSYEQLSEPMNTLHREMFGFAGSPKELTEAEKRKVRLFSGREPYDEIKKAGREIRHLIFHQGYRYKDIAVMCNNESYLPILKTVFARFEIPCFTDEKYMLTGGFLCRYAFALFDAVCSDYAREEVFDVLRHPLSGFTREECRVFEKYCAKYNIAYSRMLTPFIFGEYEEAEAVRQKAVALLSKVPPEGATVAAYCDFLTEIFSSEEVRSLREQCERDGNPALRAYSDSEHLLEVTEEIRTLCGERTSGPASFKEMFSATVAGMSISLLPQYVDSVFVGNTSDSRFSDVRALFIVGANDGYFPMQSGDNVILSSFDNEMMVQNGLPIFPTPIEKNLFEKFAVLDLVTKAERLYVGYSENDLGGELVERGEGVREIVKRLGAEVKDLSTYYPMTEDELFEYRMGTTENCYYEYMSGQTGEYTDAVRAYLLQKGLIAEGTAELKNVCPTDGYRKENGVYKISVSMLENYFHCPYRHFLTDVLHLQRKEEGVLQANDKGSILHEVLEKYFKVNSKALRTATDVEERVERAVVSVFTDKKYEHLYADVLSAYDMKQLREESVRILRALTENVRHSAFLPVKFEQRFDNEESLSLTVGEKKFSFRGTIDRVDKNGDRIYIVDYKTGRRDASYEHIYDGEKIQLYLYLKYYLDRNFRPVGAFYLPIDSGYYSQKKNYAMQGQMTDELSVLWEIDDRTARPEGSFTSPTVDFTVREKDGVLSVTTNKKNLIPEKRFYDISRYVCKLSEQALSDIDGGDIAPNPMGDACSRCDYGRICGKRECRVQPAVEAQCFSEEGGEDEV